MKQPLTTVTAAMIAVFLIGAFILISNSTPSPCTGPTKTISHHHPDLLNATVYYATSTKTPQQSRKEILETLSVLTHRAPCNFLVFGLGRDSVMWNALNAGGTTVFLEEDMNWYKSVLKGSSFLNAHVVQYRTKRSQADELLKGWKDERMCKPENAYLKGNGWCRLALENLPDVVYDTEWDVIMIDAPKGYFDEAPGRMAAIYSAAIMARARKGEGDTHIFLHDVDRKVESDFAKEFLCDKFRVGSVGRLWHFQVPPVTRRGHNTDTSLKFC